MEDAKQDLWEFRESLKVHTIPVSSKDISMALYEDEDGHDDIEIWQDDLPSDPPVWRTSQTDVRFFGISLLSKLSYLSSMSTTDLTLLEKADRRRRSGVSLFTMGVG